MNASKLIGIVVLLLLSITLAYASPAGNNVVISEVLYNPTGGAESGAEWIELYNPTSSPINISLWFIQKQNSVAALQNFPQGTIMPANSHLLIGDDGTLPASLPTPDFIREVSTLSNSASGIALVNSQLQAVDKVGWSGISDTNFVEGSAKSAAPDGNSIERKQGGSCGNAVDTDNNNNDFINNQNPTPQNKNNASVAPCNVTIVDTQAPGPISGLQILGVTNSSIKWGWTNPSDADFNATILYLNGVSAANFTKPVNNVNVSGLNASTAYTLTVNTKDHSGNVNKTNVSSTTSTLPSSAPTVPKVTLSVPTNNSIVSSASFQVDFSTQDWSVNGKGSTHIHFHINNVPGLSFSDHLMFYNGANNIIELNTNAGTTVFAAWVDQNTIQFNNVPNGAHTIRAHLANADHSVLSNPQADTFITITVDVPSCIVDEDCNDGLFCNGLEQCVSGSCEQGSAVVCDNGLFCDGLETCSEDIEACEDGSAPITSDGVTCTQDSCNEANDQIVHTPNDALCSNGLFCDGSETCSATLGCQAGTTLQCSDGLFCNGQESCNEDSDSCQSGSAPQINDNISCTQDSCNETTDQIVHAPQNNLCNDSLFCNGVETCNAATGCVLGTAIDCSANNIAGIDTCLNNPDNKAFTKDQRTDFTSTCDEATDLCTTGSSTITHACSLTCGAGCQTNSDCSNGHVCDLLSCACVSDGVPRPILTILNPLSNAVLNNSNVSISFNAQDWNISGKGQSHIVFQIDGIHSLSSTDKLHFYNSPTNVVELNNVAGPTRFATRNNSNSLILHNLSNGLHTIKAQLVYGNNTNVEYPAAHAELNFTIVLPPEPVCGDNDKNTQIEVCDGTDLQDKTCLDFGYSNPLGLSCNNLCSGFEAANCQAVCGDGNQEPGEQCDDGNTNSGDGCSAACTIEHVDDLMINYLRGSITFDGVPAPNGTQYMIEILEGMNAGLSYNGAVDDAHVSVLYQGNFDTADQLRFSSGDVFRITAQDCNDAYEGSFENGGNLGIHLDCTLLPMLSGIEHVPSNPHDLEATKVIASITDNNLDSVLLHYTLNGSINEVVPMVELSGHYEHNFGVLPYQTHIQYFVSVNDTYGNQNQSLTQQFSVITHDFDKDGSNSTLDCNENDNTIYPNAPESVDTIDQNCGNDAPSFNGPIANITWNEDANVSDAFDLDTYFDDVDDHGLLQFSVSGNQNISVVVDSSNVVQLSQPANWHGTEFITITASDNKTTRQSNVVKLNVLSVDDTPQFFANIPDVTTKETTLVNLNATGQIMAFDIDNDPITYTYACAPAPCSLGSNGQWMSAIGNKGTYEANVTATAGTLFDKQTVVIIVTKKYPGDINGDNVVNILDLLLVRKAFGKTPSSPDWNPDWDLNNDGQVNILDLLLVRKVFT